jgi:hypothetical protein
VTDLPPGRTRPPVAYDRASLAGFLQVLRLMLVFEPRTGQLLAQELLTLRPQRLSTYVLVLETARTHRIG